MKLAVYYNQFDGIVNNVYTVQEEGEVRPEVRKQVLIKALRGVEDEIAAKKRVVESETEEVVPGDVVELGPEVPPVKDFETVVVEEVVDAPVKEEPAEEVPAKKKRKKKESDT